MQNSAQYENEQNVYRDVATHMTASVAYCDCNYRYLWVSESCAAMLGASKADMEGHPIPDMIGTQAFDTIKPHMDRALNGNALHYEAHVNYARVGWRWISSTYVPTLSASGKPVGWVATVSDTTRVKELEDAFAARELERAGSVATLAHELRGPLCAIRNGLHLLKTGKDAGVRDLATMIDRQSYILKRLIDDSIDEYGVSRRNLTWLSQLVLIEKVLRTAVDTALPFLRERGHRLLLKGSDNAIYVRGDPVKLGQVFGNLLINAGKFTPSDGLIEVNWALVGRCVEVSVKDNGIGIPRHRLSDIFDKYVQVDSNDSRGMGIGLSVVKNVVTLHGGHVEARSEGTGRGAEFVVRLPLAEIPEP